MVPHEDLLDLALIGLVIKYLFLGLSLLRNGFLDFSLIYQQICVSYPAIIVCTLTSKGLIRKLLDIERINILVVELKPLSLFIFDEGVVVTTIGRPCVHDNSSQLVVVVLIRQYSLFGIVLFVHS